DNWSSNDINMVKDIIADCIPHIRFFNMFPEKALLFDDLLPRELHHDILNYQMKKDYIPNTTILLPRTRQRCNMNSVIFCYKNGIGVEKDAKTAFELYQKAAEQGHATAQTLLGVCYQHGLGVEK